MSTAEVLLAAEPDVRSELIRRSLDEGWDQAYARVAVRALEYAVVQQANIDEHPVSPDSPAEESGLPHRTSTQPEPRTLVGASRLPGFTRAVREFHRGDHDRAPRGSFGRGPLRFASTVSGPGVAGSSLDHARATRLPATARRSRLALGAAASFQVHLRLLGRAPSANCHRSLADCDLSRKGAYRPNSQSRGRAAMFHRGARQPGR